jgi:hypothetical protein
MKLKTAILYSSMTFISLYAILSVSLRILKLTEDYFSHVIAGIIATLLALLVFMLNIVKDRKKK